MIGSTDAQYTNTAPQAVHLQSRLTGEMKTTGSFSLSSCA